MALTQASEGGLKISNAGTNGQFLQKQSGNTGGLTWADASVGGGTGTDYNDSVKVRFGTGNDLELYHNGTNSYIDNGEGDLWIKSNGDDLVLQALDDILIRPQNGENGIKVLGDAGVELYYDDIKKLETTSGGVTVTGNLSATSNLLLADSVKARFGTGEDLQIYHDGTDARIENSTGRIINKTHTNVGFYNSAGSETLAIFTVNNSCDLYYDNVKKLETTSYGVLISSRLNAQTISIEDWDSTNETGAIKLGTGNDLQIYHDGSNSFIADTGTGGLILRSQDLTIQGNATTENLTRFIENGGVELYYDNVKKFETTSDGVTVTGTGYVSGGWRPSSNGGASLGSSSYRWYDLNISNDIDISDNGVIQLGDGDDLQIYHDGSNSFIKNSTGGPRVLADDFAVNNLANNETIFQAVADGSCDLYHNGSKVFETLGNGVRAQGGIMFGSDTADANRITDYEQGTFTPILRTNGDTTGQVTGSGTYVKIGRAVHIHVLFGNKTLTSLPTGDIAVVSLPFTANQTNGDEFGMSSKMVVMGVDSNSTHGYFRTGNGSAAALGYFNQDGSTWAQWSTTQWDNSGVYLIFNMTYFTNS